jgi:glycosyltransferase involved in cell wall biosynthesis
MVTTFYSPHVGGIENHVANLSKHLVADGHKVTVLTSKLKENTLPSQNIPDDKIKVVNLNTKFLPAWPYKSMSSMGLSHGIEKTIKAISEQEQIDIIHVHGHHYPLSWSAISAANKLNLPCVLTIHGHYALGPSRFGGNTFEELFNSTLFKNILSKVNAVIGLTPTITSYAKKYGPKKEKYYTVPNGVDLPTSYVSDEAKTIYKLKYSLPLDKTIILFRGRFVDIKGVLELAQAAKQLLNERKDLFFLFVGEGLLLEQLKEITACYSSNSKIIGWVPEEEKNELYSVADIFVLPSKAEALPIALIEAMANRLFIAATPVGGVPDVLTDYPWKTFIQKTFASQIVKALNTALTCFNKKSSEEITAVSKLLQRYDWNKVTQEIQQIYSLHINNNPDLTLPLGS